MRLTPDTKPMGLPPYIKMGMELEVENVNGRKVAKSIEELKGWKVEKDASLSDGGVETVSPVLDESKNPQIWEDLAKVCEAIDKYPQDESRESYADHTCGGHIHFDAQVFENNPEVLINLLRLWAEGEELVYKMCNDKGDSIRESALDFSFVNGVKKTLFSFVSEAFKQAEAGEVNPVKFGLRGIQGTWKGLIETTQSLSYRDGYAYSNGKRIKKSIRKDGLELETQEGILKPTIRFKFNRRLEKMAKHYSGLNLQNIDTRKHYFEKMGKKRINTTEFRISNGSKDPRVWKENAFLYSSLIQTAYRMTYEPDEINSRASAFWSSDVSEEEKLDRFLELIMDYPEDRNVYKQRWQSVKNAPVFKGKYTRGFAKDTFKREDYETLSLEVGIKKVRETLGYVTSKAKEFMRDENSGFSIESMIIE